MLPWTKYRASYFHTLTDACVLRNDLSDGDIGRNVLAFIRAGTELAISAFVVLFYLSRRRQALKDGRITWIVLPSYAYILYWIAFLQAIHIVVVSMRAYEFEDERDNNIVGNVTIVVRLIVAILEDGIIASVVVLLHRRGSGITAIHQSLRIGHFLGFLATLSVWFEIPLSPSYPIASKWIAFSSNTFFFIGVFSLLFAPPRSFPKLLGFRRSSVIPLLRFLLLCVFLAVIACIIELLVLAGYGSSVLGHGNENVGTCLSYCNNLVFSSLWPLAVYYCLRNDSNYWRGISNSSFLQRWIKGNAESDGHVGGGTSLQGSINTILKVNEEGTDRNLGMLLADRIHQLPVTLPHLDFAYLKMDASTPLIGSGGSARVFNATYKGQAVALKMVWCVELDEVVITDFCRECALIASLPPHPNVLPSLGLCIFPPVLCLVTPLCITDLFHLVHPIKTNNNNNDNLKKTYERPSSLQVEEEEDDEEWIEASEEHYNNNFEASEEENNGGRKSLFIRMSTFKNSISSPFYRTSEAQSFSDRKSMTTGIFGFNFNKNKRKSKRSENTHEIQRKTTVPNKDWSDTMQLCVDACAAVAFLHEASVVHGDIKSPNFLVRGAVEHSISVANSKMGNSLQKATRRFSQLKTSLSPAATAKANDAVIIDSSNFSSMEVPGAKHRCVIADLGNSQRVDESPDNSSSDVPNAARTISTVLGSSGGIEGSEVLTPQWSPPEILLHHKSPSFSADVYSLAVVLYEILTNQIPFDGVIASEIIKQVEQGVRLPFPSKPPSVPEDKVNVLMFQKFWTLISKALNDIPHVRPLALDLLVSAKACVVMPTDESGRPTDESLVDSISSKTSSVSNVDVTGEEVRSSVYDPSDTYSLQRNPLVTTTTNM